MSDAGVIDFLYKEPDERALFHYDRGIARVYVDQGTDTPVSMVFDQIHSERRTNEVGAEVVFYGGTNGSTRLLHRTRLNLSSTRSREDTAKHLKTRLAGLAWSELLEVASWKVIDAHRQGPKPILLRDAAEPPGGTVLLPPLLLATDPVVLFGDGGTGKSYLALALALSVHTGRPLVAGLKPNAQLRTAYLDFEWQPWPHKQRMRALWGADELPDLVYVPCRSDGSLTYQIDRLRGIFHEQKIEYAVLDSVALACDGPPEEAEVALRFFQALARLEVGSTLLAHINKGGDTDKPFGSTFWHNNARASWFIQGVQEAGEAGLDIGLYQRKINDGAKATPLGLHLAFSSGSTVISRADLSTVPELASGLSLKLRIRSELSAGALTCPELAERLTVDVESVRTTVKRHQGKVFTILPGSPYRVGLQSPHS